MKLTIIGGGGVRAPLLVSSILNRSRQIHLDEICLMDINRAKLELIGSLCAQIAKDTHLGVNLTTTTDTHSALQDAAYVITTVRVGEDAGRIVDEKIAMHHGVLGQETTGAGGFAMALRSIPVIMEYARMLEDLSPGAWIINFTNPAGLVTQALRDAGFERVIGICDSANNAQKAVAKWHNLSVADFARRSLWSKSFILVSSGDTCWTGFTPTAASGSLFRVFHIDACFRSRARE